MIITFDGFDVAVDLAGRMEHPQSLEQLAEDVEHPVPIGLLAEPLPHLDAVDKFHDQEPHVASGAELVELHEVLVDSLASVRNSRFNW